METRALSKPSSVGDRLVMKEVEESPQPISRRKRSQGSLASTVGCEDDHATVDIFARVALVPGPSAYL